MAKKTIEIVYCDVCGDEIEDNGARVQAGVTLTIGGQGVHLDLCASHQRAFDQALEPYLTSGTPLQRAKAAKMAGNGPNRRDPATTEAIRAWGKANGFAIAARGRIPASVEQAYRACRAA